MNKIILVLVLGITSCGHGPGPVIGNAVIDCLGENRPQIDALLLELTPIITSGKTDWAAVYQRAKQAGTAVGGCVLAELVQSYLGGTRAPEAGDGWNAHQALEEFRHNEAGGATFSARCVRQDGTVQTCKL